MAKLSIALLLLLSLATAAPALAQQADPHNPQPAADDLTLPMPGGASVAFRPIFIGEGDSPFAQRKFNMGDPQGGFKENPTSVSVGGAFLVKNKSGGEDWLFYLAKYELTEGQYYAVMGLPQGADKALLHSRKPMAGLSWFQANEFVDRYNQWLFVNAKGKLPDHGGQPGYVRLPSEAEWEFAARGGAAVSSDVFDRRHPYDKPLEQCEWFAGAKSSHNVVKDVGLLAPNPLGLHDMLGNVCEMTHGLYQVEYYQGRNGGFTARGGHFLTDEKSLRSAMRAEQPFYLAGGGQIKANAKPTMGLRLALGGVVFADRNAARQMAEAWEGYRAGKGAALPAAVSVSPTSAQAGVKGRDAMDHLARLKKELAGQALSPGAAQQLGLLEASLGNIEFVLKQADEDSAYAWAKIAAERGFFLQRELAKLPTLQRLMTIAQDGGRTAMVEKYKERLNEFQANIDEAMSTYSESFRQLDKISPPAVDAGFTKYAKFLLERQAAAQLSSLKVVREQYAAFNKEKRANPELWRKQFEALGQGAQ